MANKITDTSNYYAIANSIRSKLNTQSTYTPIQMAAAIDSIPVTDIEALSVTDNGTYTAPTGTAYSPVTVNVSGGSSSKEPNDVNFYDYDGTIVDSYSASDFLALTAMPENPSHTGLTAQGWNWNLSDTKEYITDYGKLNVGQMYITDDGKTRIYVHMEEGRLHPYLGICPNGTVEVDWGDGSAVSTLTGTSLTAGRTADHEYASEGDYVITLTATSGRFAFHGRQNVAYILRKDTGTSSDVNTVYASCVKKVELGANVNIGQYAFSNCTNLKAITIPAGVMTEISTYSFFNCYSLTTCILPHGITTLYNYSFMGCHALTTVMIPNSVTLMGSYTFNNCYGMQEIIIPNGVATISTYAFQYCYSLANVTIPGSVSSIEQMAFNSCKGVGAYHIKRATPPTLGSNAFNSIPSDCIIYVPSESLEAYQAANNWSNYASKMVGE